jgi:hypothetical protein
MSLVAWGGQGGWAAEALELVLPFITMGVTKKQTWSAAKTEHQTQEAEAEAVLPLQVRGQETTMEIQQQNLGLLVVPE